MKMPTTKAPITSPVQPGTTETSKKPQETTIHKARSLKIMTGERKPLSWFEGKVHFVKKRSGEAVSWMRNRLPSAKPVPHQASVLVASAPKQPANSLVPSTHPACADVTQIVHNWIDFKIADLPSFSVSPELSHHVGEMKKTLTATFEKEMAEMAEIDAAGENPFSITIEERIDTALEAAIASTRHVIATDAADAPSYDRLVSALFPTFGAPTPSYQAFKADVEAVEQTIADMREASDIRASKMSHEAKTAEIVETTAAPIPAEEIAIPVEALPAETPPQAEVAAPLSDAERLTNDWNQLLGTLNGKGFEKLVVNQPSRFQLPK